MKAPRLEPCLSESSSMISVSDAPMESQREGKQLEEQDQKHPQDINPNVILDLSLSSKDSDHGSKPELNLIDCFETGSSQNSMDTPQVNETEPRVFSCNYCQRKFYSSQALGGHQNAHKRERTLAKRGQRIGAAAAAFGHSDSHLHRYHSMASLPLHGSFNRSLGIQVHSMIHKPSFLQSTIGSSHLYGHHGWSRQPIDQQPAIGRLAPENYHAGTTVVSSSSGGAARFESVRKFSSTGEGIGSHWWDTSGSHLKPNQDELQKLDLSLKL